MDSWTTSNFYPPVLYVSHDYIFAPSDCSSRNHDAPEFFLTVLHRQVPWRLDYTIILGDSSLLNFLDFFLKLGWELLTHTGIKGLMPTECIYETLFSWLLWTELLDYCSSPLIAHNTWEREDGFNIASVMCPVPYHAKWNKICLNYMWNY